MLNLVLLFYKSCNFSLISFGKTDSYQLKVSQSKLLEVVSGLMFIQLESQVET